MPLWLIFSGLENVDQFDVKNQHGTWADSLSGAAFAVSEFGRDKQAVFAADVHQLQCFGPAFDHLSDAEFGGFSALDGAVEFSSVQQ